MIAFLDLETGGFSITKNGICEIALIVVDRNYEVVDTFHTLIQPYTRLDDLGNPSDELVSYKDDAMAVNGLTIEKLISEGLNIELVTNDLWDFIIANGIKTIIGHNSKAFDIPRVKYLLERFMSHNIDHITLEDTMLMAKSKFKLSSYSLENLCTYFEIINTDEHTAKGDVLATIELYKKLI
jgi:DNA polymerase III epsilon subunit-like protein